MHCCMLKIYIHWKSSLIRKPEHISGYARTYPVLRDIYSDRDNSNYLARFEHDAVVFL